MNATPKEIDTVEPARDLVDAYIYPGFLGAVAAVIGSRFVSFRIPTEFAVGIGVITGIVAKNEVLDRFVNSQKK